MRSGDSFHLRKPAPAIRRACREPCRRDGWTAERQLAFLETLASARSVSRAAAAAGMSRESAYRLRDRRDGALFAALWDRILAPRFAPVSEDHITALGNGALMRLLGNHFRRQRGDFANFARRAAETRGR